MRSWKSFLLGAVILLAGCNDDDSLVFLMEKPVTTRPIVAIVPVMDMARHQLAWNISDELTLAIRQRLTQHNHLYLLGADQVYAMTRRSVKDKNRDPFGIDTSWVRKAYPQNEFVAFFELVEHREIPLTLEAVTESPAELNMAVRVRVFDLRAEEPKVVLQEIVEQSHHIPQQFTHSETPEAGHVSSQVAWGNETFDISPLGIAHEKLCQEIAARVEDYILLNCQS